MNDQLVDKNTNLFSKTHELRGSALQQNEKITVNYNFENTARSFSNIKKSNNRENDVFASYEELISLGQNNSNKRSEKKQNSFSAFDKQENEKTLDIHGYLKGALASNTYHRCSEKARMSMKSQLTYNKNMSIIRISNNSELKSINSSEMTALNPNLIKKPLFRPNLKEIMNKNISIDIEDYLNLPSKAFLSVISYLGDDSYELYVANVRLKRRTVSAFKSEYENMINNFKLLYSDLLLFSSASLTISLVRRRLIINVKIKSKLKTSQYEGKTVTLSSLTKIKGKTDVLNSIYRFDFLYRSNVIRWISRELTKFHSTKQNTTYAMPIDCFSAGDFIELNVTVFSANGLIDEEVNVWLRPSSESLKYMGDNVFREIHNLKEMIDFDLSRYCDIELAKKGWADISHYPFGNHEMIEVKLQQVYGDCFKISKIHFDDVGYFIFKIFLKAVKKGEVINSQEIGMRLKVVGESEAICNTVKKNGLVFDSNEGLQMRKGDELIVYLTMDKYV